MGNSYDFRKGRKPAESSELKELNESPQGTRSNAALHHLMITPAAKGGLIVEHHLDSYDSKPKREVFEKSEDSPELPKGHPLQRIATALKIPHRIMGKQETAEDTEETELVPE